MYVRCRRIDSSKNTLLAFSVLPELQQLFAVVTINVGFADKLLFFSFQYVPPFIPSSWGSYVSTMQCNLKLDNKKNAPELVRHKYA